MTLFRFTVTNRADDKDHWTPCQVEPDQFIRNLINGGHRIGQKDGPGIIAGTFPKGAHLEQKNLEVATGLILDIDGKTKKTKDTPSTARLSEDGKFVLEVIPPDWLLAKLPFRGVAHSSHTCHPTQPKYRVIMPLAEPVSLPEFMRLWFWIFEKVERKADPACKNPDRMFFLPRATAEAKENGWHWIRAMHGPLLSVSMIPAEFKIPDEYAYELSRPQRKQGAHSAPPATRFRHTDAHKLLDSLLDLPIYHWAIEAAEELTREVWRGLATNIAAAVMEDDSAIEAGAKAFHEISEADENRYQFQNTEKTFRDALKSAAHPGPMSYATLKLNGAPDDLDEGDAKAPVAHARKLLYIQETAYRPKPQAPAASTAPATGAPPATTPAASTTTASSGSPVAAAEPEEDDSDEADTHKFTQDDFLFDMQRNGYVMEKPVDKMTAAREWNLDVLYQSEAINKLLLSEGMQKKFLEDWKAQIKHFRYVSHDYTKPYGLVPLDKSTMIFNTYKPTQLVPTPGNWDLIKELFLHLVGGDQDALEYTLDWYASPLQKLRDRVDPDLNPYKMGTGLVLRGDPGAGKGTAMSIISLCYGLHNRVILGQEDLDGKFHTNIENKLFVVCNEVMSGSNRSAQTANKLKSWVTDPEIPCEGKYADAGMIPNNFNIVFTSNDDKPVLIDRYDRRYSVFQSAPISKKIIGPIYDDLLGPQVMVSAFFYDLLDRKVKVKYGELYETVARKQVQGYSAPTSDRFAEAILEDGFMSVAQSWVESARNGEIREPVITHEGHFYVNTEVLMEVYKHYCKSVGAYAQGVQALTKALQDKFPAAVSSHRIKVGNIRRRVWQGLPIDPDQDLPRVPTVLPQKETEIPIENLS